MESTNEVESEIKEQRTDSVSKNAMTSYLSQWQEYFENIGEKGLLANLREKTFNDSLRSCHFRSICWRVFLGSLSDDVKEWPDMVSKSREFYKNLLQKHVTNPHDEKQQSIDVENPLSQNDQSTWLQYFRNNELRNVVNRDVLRICPEQEFYHTDERRTMMANVLFCYAREHENLSYRQGMHELLAPLVFVLHCDLQGAAHARDMGQLPDNISEILDEKYIEHDLYSMFYQLMDVTNSWYSVKEQPIKGEENKSPIPSEPFKTENSFPDGPPLVITNKLNHIHHNLLKTHDLELYHHITRLEIIPQVYGLRWIRLLFGREFDLQDLLVLWDSIFADSRSLDLVDYVFVAMLHNIREQLLACDYCSCTQLLMKYPPIEDIYDLVHLASYYRKPETEQRPSHNRFKGVNQISNQPVNKKVVPVPKKNSANNFFSGLKFDNPFSNKKLNLTQKKPSSNTTFYVKTSTDLPVKKQPPIQKINQMKIIDQSETETLQKQLSDLRLKCQNCFDILDTNIATFQQYFNPTNSTDNPTEGVDPEGIPPNNEKMLVAVAKLKQARDILRDSVNVPEKN